MEEENLSGAGTDGGNGPSNKLVMGVDCVSLHHRRTRRWCWMACKRHSTAEVQ